MPSAEVIAQLGTAPISEAAPTGIDAKYEPAFEALKAEVDKIGSLSGAEVDWRRVVELATRLLANTSKDQLVACYLAYGMLQQDGWPGLVAGLELLDGLCRTFWDGMYPPVHRLRARVSACSWLIERVESWTQANGPFGPAAREPVAAAIALCGRISEVCDEALAPEGGSGMFGLMRTLRDVAEQIDIDHPQGDDASEPGSEPASSPTAAEARTATPRPPGSGSAPAARLDAGDRAARGEALRRLEDIAAFFEQAEPHSPIGPMLRRARRWADMSYVRLYQELLRPHGDSLDRLWDTLGVDPDAALAAAEDDSGAERATGSTGQESSSSAADDW